MQEMEEWIGREMAEVRECLQKLALEVARLSQAVEPLVQIQEDQGALRDRVAQLEGFRAAVLWLVGLVGTGAIMHYIVTLWTGGR